MCPVVDINGDGIDELFWGERCLELDKGQELFCADRDTYQGHSDVIQPWFDEKSKKWFIYTIRESDGAVKPRVVLFDSHGKRVWGDVEEGHMDMGWVASLRRDSPKIAMAIRIGHKTCGPDGRFHTGMNEFIYEALSGKPVNLGFSVYRTIPVDLNGDGIHELVRGQASGNGEVLDGQGQVITSLGTAVALACKFINHPGEQLLAYYPDGKLVIYADENATDSRLSQKRYAHPFYQSSCRLSATGYNLVLLGGI